MGNRDTSHQQASHDSLARRYRRFADEEAHGISPTYERLTRAVAADRDVLSFLADLPPDRQQPNLFLAAVRHLFGVPADGAALRGLIHEHHAAVRRMMLARTTQTNEPGRCAVLLPVLASLPQPLALIEVGAAAGLCLLPDVYGYDYGTGDILQPGDPDAPVFPCRISGPVPLPATVPTVVWRQGMDLNPLDLGSAPDMDWLETLVWPEQTDRRQRLRAAIAVARRQAPRVVRGDLTRDLETLMADAPSDATLVVFHTAVLNYVSDKAARQRFADLMRQSTAVWISNESPRAFVPSKAGLTTEDGQGRFLMSVNGDPVAWTGPHGQSLDWLGD